MSKGINFGTLGFVTQKQFGPLKELCDALSKVSGAVCYNGALYEDKTVDGHKAVFWIRFGDILSLNRFMWAGCRRYFNLLNYHKWTLVADCADPEFNNSNSINMMLCYRKLNASVEEMEIDFNDLRQGVENYLELVEKLYKETEDEQSN